MPLDRRNFLKTSTLAAAAGGLAARHALGETPKEISEIRVGVIGLNGRGGSHLDGFGKNVVAICDCDLEVLSNRARRYDNVETFTDYRKLLERDDIHAVSIATPNHTHSLIGIMAALAGKDVYVEKPVSQTVWEGRQLANAAKKYNRIIQCGTQSRSSPSLKEAVAFVQGGNLGAIKYAIGTCFKPRGSIGKLTEPLKIPDSLDYNLWCGPAAMAPIYRPKLHYDWHWDFNTGSGDMGNQGIHQMDIARWFLGEKALSPKVLSIGGRLGYEDAGNTPNTQIVVHAYEKAPLFFETRGLRAYAGGRQMDRYRGSQIGVVVQCENGHVLVPSYTSAVAFDADGNKIKEWHGGGDHFKNFLQAVVSRDASSLNAEVTEGHLSSALCHTGNISHRLGEPVAYDEIADKFASDAMLSSSLDRMAGHLRANDVNIDGAVLTLGPTLAMDPQTERFTNSDPANGLLHREDRPEFAIPKIDV